MEAPGEAARSRCPPGVERTTLWTDGTGLSHSPLLDLSPSLPPQTLPWEPVAPDSRRPPSLCTQPYLQRTASLSGRASYTHTSLSSSSPVTATARPRSRAAVASLMVQPMGTWKGRSLQSCRALCRGCPSHSQPLPQGAHLVGREPSARQGEGRAQPGLQQLIRHPDTSPLAALGLLPAGFNLQSWPRPLLRLCRAVLSLGPAAAWGTEQTAEQEGSYKPLTRPTSSRTRLLP